MVFVLIEQKTDAKPEVITVCKSNPLQMLMKYYKINNVKHIYNKCEVDPLVLEGGKYLIQENLNEFHLYEVKEVEGYIYNSVAFEQTA